METKTVDTVLYDAVSFAEATRDSKATEGSKFITWKAAAIKAGLSKNGYIYTAETLKNAVDAGLFEGVPVYDYSEEAHHRGAAGVKDLIGHFGDATFRENAVYGNVNLLKESETARKLDAFWESGVDKAKPKLSINGAGKLAARSEGGTRSVYVESISAINSVDVVINAAAGGGFLQRIAEAVNVAVSQDEDKVEPVMENKEEQKTEKVDVVAQVEEMKKLFEAERKERELDRKRDKARIVLEKQLTEATTLSAKAKDRVRRELETAFIEGSIPDEDEIAKFVDAERDYIAESVKFVAGNTSLGISVGNEPQDNKAVALEKMLFGDNPSIVKTKVSESDPGEFKHWDNTPAFRSIHEAIRELCDSDPIDWSSWRDAKLTSPIALRKMNSDGTLSEAMSTTDFPYVLENIMTKRLLKEYARPELNYWRNLVNIVPLKDLKQQSRLRMGGFGNLPSIEERGDYTDLQNLSEERVQYTPTKYGGTAQVTLEMLINDDLQALRNIAPKLGRAAGNTILEFVESFIVDNGVVYDGTALIDTTHGNKGAGALTQDTLFTAWNAMMVQTETVTTTGAGTTTKRLHIKPKFLLVPPKLASVAYEITTRASGESNMVATFQQMLGLQPFLLRSWTDDKYWYLVADPSAYDTIEIGFLAGRDQPSLFLQNSETEGEMFARDALTWKIRWWYGGAVTNYKSFYGYIG